MEIINDLQFWNIVISGITVISTFVVYLLQRNKKRLVYRILTATSLLSVRKEVREKITIRYGNKKINNIYLVLLEIENAGNVPAIISDFVQPIVFSISGSEILDAEIVSATPKSLKPVIGRDATKLEIKPILLNKTDRFTIKLLLSRHPDSINVDARIIGVKEIEHVLKDEHFYTGIDLGAKFILASAVVYFVKDMFFDDKTVFAILLHVLTVILLSLGAFSIVIGFAKSISEEKNRNKST